MGTYKAILRKNFILMVIANILVGTAQMAVNTNSAAYALNEIGVTQAQFGTIVAVSALFEMVTRPLGGILCDKLRYGVSGVIGCALHAFAFFMYLSADSFGMLLLSRSLQLMAFGFVLTACLSIATASVSKKLRSAAMTLYGLGPALSYFTGPQTGTSLIQSLGYETMFKACMVITGIGILLFLFNTAKASEDPDEPKVKRKAFGFEKTAIPGFILSFLVLHMVFIGQGYITISLLERGIANAALFWSVGAVINVIGRFCLTKIIAKVGINKTFYVTVGLLALSVLLVVVAQNIAVVIVAAACWGIGYNGAQACVMSLSVLRATPETIGSANATHQMGHNAANVVWGWVAGILAGILGYQGMFLVMLLPMAAGVVYFVAVARRIVNNVAKQNKQISAGS